LRAALPIRRTGAVQRQKNDAQGRAGGRRDPEELPRGVMALDLICVKR
jgi:hypothetical protein